MSLVGLPAIPSSAARLLPLILATQGHPVANHASDNDADRRIGQRWERAFCQLAAGFDKVFSPHQIPHPEGAAVAYGRGDDGQWENYLLPDVTIWSAPGEHHEIKHKRPSWDGCYGLERYRLDALVRWANTTGQLVCYTIHDWKAAGADAADTLMPNDLSHWFYADVIALTRGCTWVQENGTSWVNGKRRNDVLIWYWTAHRYFKPLSELWVSPQKTT